MFSTSAGAAGSLSGGAVACSRPWRTSSWYIFWYMLRIRKRTDLSMSTVFDDFEDAWVGRVYFGDGASRLADAWRRMRSAS